VPDAEKAMNGFLAGVEKRALRMAEFATGNRDDALELVQDAMLGMVRRYASHHSDDWPPLFHRILQNGIRDWHRREAVRRKWRYWFPAHTDTDHHGMDAVADPNAVEPSEHLARSQSGEVLLAALAALSLRQQQAFMLRVWEGLDVAQTARAMSCSQGSVKTHYSRAVHRLREDLEGHWP